jgi:hypothetical protein
MTDTYNPLARPEAVVQAQRDKWDGIERRLPENAVQRKLVEARQYLNPPIELRPINESPEPWNGGAIRGLMFAIPIAAVLWAAAYFIIKAVTR